MHVKTLQSWRHGHDFAVVHEKGERRTTQVLILTATTMVVEIVAGTIFGSMALLADGWHMGTHGAAFMISLYAYRYARKHENDPAFTFGTGKVSVLGGFASAVALLVVALVMCVESIERIFNPQKIHFEEAIGVAILGLAVNLVSAVLLQDHRVHDPTHGDAHADHNLKAAYFHVLADALTSVSAIVALVCGRFFDWVWLDPVVGIAGALVISRWSYVLMKESAPVLLDQTRVEDMKAVIRAKVESDSDNRIADLHLWKVGPEDYALIVSLVTHFPKPTEYYKALLDGIPHLSHITIEVHRCLDDPCIPVNTGVAPP